MEHFQPKEKIIEKDVWCLHFTKQQSKHRNFIVGPQWQIVRSQKLVGAVDVKTKVAMDAFGEISKESIWRMHDDGMGKLDMESDERSLYVQVVSSQWGLVRAII